MEREYTRLFNENNVLTHWKDAIRGNKYKLYQDTELDFVFKQGDKREYYATIIGTYNNYGESPEHYNAKMEIVNNKYYYDTIFKQNIYFDEVIPEKTQNTKRPDLSCYTNNKLVCCIEIFYTNAKNEIDIEELKKIQVPIIEINIKNENRCKHIILPTLLEINRKEFNRLEIEKREIQINGYKARNRWTELYAEIRKRIREYDSKVRRITTVESEIRHFEEQILRIDKSNANRNESETTFNAIKIKRNTSETIQRIEKGNIEILRIKGEIKTIENEFNKIAENCKIEWFRNSWIKYKPQNLIQEIKYWIN
jgi:hypothetical protein